MRVTTACCTAAHDRLGMVGEIPSQFTSLVRSDHVLVRKANTMPSNQLPPEIRFLADPLSGSAAVVLALAALGATLWWTRRGDRVVRQVILLAATASAVALVGINIVARMAGWWVGPAFAPRPFAVLMLLTLLGGVPGWVLWLAGYRWLARRIRWPLLAYGALVLLFIPVVVIVDRWQMGRNQFQMANGYQIWHDVVLGQLVMWSPVLFYELLVRHVRGERDST